MLIEDLNYLMGRTEGRIIIVSIPVAFTLLLIIHLYSNKIVKESSNQRQARRLISRLGRTLKSRVIKQQLEIISNKESVRIYFILVRVYVVFLFIFFVLMWLVTENIICL